MSPANNEAILSSAAVSAYYNIILQFVFRILTFLLNAFILRYISHDTLGIVNVRLTLLYTTVLFISREAFRRACLSKSFTQSWQQMINLLWCIVPIGLVSAVLLSVIWTLYLDTPDPRVIPYYQLAVWCYAASAVIEMVSEPVYVTAQLLLYVRLKVVIEGISLAVRCVLTVCLLFVFTEAHLLAFIVAQLCFTSCMTVLYYSYFIYLINSKKDDKLPFRSTIQLLPTSIQQQSWVDKDLLNLTWSFFKQSFLKQLLTEGEKYVMTVFDVLTFADQGIYDVISNLGSLLPRFIFLPLEDSSYLLFTQVLSRDRQHNTQDKLSFSFDVLNNALKMVLLLGMTLCVYSVGYSYVLLDLYGGSTLSRQPGPMLLQFYGVYVLLLALNGISEAFAFATMSKEDIDRYNKKMLGFSVVFLLSSLLFVRYFGSVGFILANCLNMSVRIIHSVWYITQYFNSTLVSTVRDMCPSMLVIITFLGSLSVTLISKGTFCCTYGIKYTAIHLGIGGVCLVINYVFIYMFEENVMSFLYELFTKRKRSKTKDE